MPAILSAGGIHSGKGKTTMVNPVASGVSTYPTSQPSFASGAEARAVTEQVQPRQAPAAESQRGDQKLGNRDEDRRTEQRAVANASPRRTDDSDASARRGSNLDVVV